MHMENLVSLRPRPLSIKQCCKLISTRDSVMCKLYVRRGDLVAKIKSFMEQPDIDHVFVILHFDGPPRHFSCLHVRNSEVIYYDSLRNSVDRPFNEYQCLRELGNIEIHKPEFLQEADECGCMVVLRYWHLFHGKPYNLSGKEARAQVLNYYKLK